MPQSNGSSSIRRPPSTSRRSPWEPRLPASATSYTVYVGRSFGDLNPSDPNNTIITDIGLAPKNAAGRVEYVANFQIITPTDPAQRNGLMIHSVPNRGGNSITTTALLQGVTYVQSGWQGDLLAQCSPSTAIPYPCFDLNSGPYGSLNTTTGAFTASSVPDVAGAGGLKTLAGFVAQVPVATNGSGQPPITGAVYGHVCTGTNGCGLAVGSAPTSTAQLVIQGPAFVALPAGKHGHDPGSVLDRVLANVQRRDWRKDADPERPVGLGLLPQWLARHAKSQLDLSEDRHVQPEPSV